jgi:hypothetical protein
MDIKSNFLLVLPIFLNIDTVKRWTDKLFWFDVTQGLIAIGKTYLFAFRTFDSGAMWVGNLQGSW